MAEAPWDRRSAGRNDQIVDELLTNWLTREVIPFSTYWGTRLAAAPTDGRAGLARTGISTEAHLAAQGGPGNPDLLVLPTEDEFKRHAGRRDLFAGARESRGGAAARRALLYRRYKPVHVHEAGVGVLLAIAYTRSDLDRLHLAGARLVEVLGLTAADSLISLVPAGPSIDHWGLYHAALATRMTALHLRGEGRPPLGAALRSFAMLPASVLAVPRDEAIEVLTELRQRGTDATSLRTLVVVGPPPRARLRAELTDAASRLAGTDVRVQAVWGPQMGRVLYGECRPPGGDPGEATYGLHTYPDLEHLEVRDDALDTPAGRGDPGELITTSLGWRGTALVRAATGDWVGGLVRTVPCPACGRTVPRIAPQVSVGAWQPRVRGRDSQLRRVDLRGARAALEDAGLTAAGIRDWSLRIEDDRLVLALDLPPHETEIARRLANGVGARVGMVPSVRLSSAHARQQPQVGAAGPS